jgi:hypothetical protein
LFRLNCSEFEFAQPRLVISRTCAVKFDPAASPSPCELCGANARVQILAQIQILQIVPM